MLLVESREVEISHYWLFRESGLLDVRGKIDACQVSHDI
jgi:hypothetical protein